MNSMRLSLLLVLSPLAPAVNAAGPQDVADQMIAPELVLRHAEELGLSPDQRKAVQEQMPAPGQMRNLLDRLQTESAALVDLLAREKPDEASVLAQFDKVSAIEEELKRVRLQSTVRVKNILTAEQQARARGLKLRGDNSGQPNRTGAKLRRVKEGLEQWTREGRDVSRIRELWRQFGELSRDRRNEEADRALDEAIAILEGKK